MHSYPCKTAPSLRRSWFKLELLFTLKLIHSRVQSFQLLGRHFPVFRKCLKPSSWWWSFLVRFCVPLKNMSWKEAPDKFVITITITTEPNLIWSERIVLRLQMMMTTMWSKIKSDSLRLDPFPSSLSAAIDRGMIDVLIFYSNDRSTDQSDRWIIGFIDLLIALQDLTVGRSTDISIDGSTT